MELKKIRQKLDELKIEVSIIQNDISDKQLDIRNNNRELKKYEQAKSIIREVGIKTQEQLQYHISDITSLALEAVFPNPYKLELEFIQRRNKTECDIFFSRDGNRIDPLSGSGGGAVDVASFALRIASWSLEVPHSRRTIILDEPMKFVSEEYKDLVSAMIKEVSCKLGLQLIIVTHEPKLTAYADKVFEVTNKKGISKVTTSL